MQGHSDTARRFTRQQVGTLWDPFVVAPPPRARSIPTSKVCQRVTGPNSLSSTSDRFKNRLERCPALLQSHATDVGTRLGRVMRRLGYEPVRIGHARTRGWQPADVDGPTDGGAAAGTPASPSK